MDSSRWFFDYGDWVSKKIQEFLPSIYNSEFGKYGALILVVLVVVVGFLIRFSYRKSINQKIKEAALSNAQILAVDEPKNPESVK